MLPDKPKKLGDKRKTELEEIKKERVSIYVCTPAYKGQVDTDYSQSLAESSFACPLYGVNITIGVMGNCAFIDLARNIFVQKFLDDNPDCTHLFFIDSDLKFEARGLIGLATAGLPICAGAYRRRQEEEDYPVRFIEHPEQGGLWVEDGWLMADRVPTGFLCIRRDVLEEMAAEATLVEVHGQEKPIPWLFSCELIDEGEKEGRKYARLIGEDFWFCDRYIEKYNKPIPVWMNLDFVHEKWEGNYYKYLERKILEEQERKSNDQSSAA